MNRLVVTALAISIAATSAWSQSASSHATHSPGATQSAHTPSMPSQEEIGELLSKTNEYVEIYRQTFTTAKPSLDKVPSKGFYEKGLELSSQASAAIKAIQKNGPSAYALVGLIAILDDMSLNAARATAELMLLGIQEDRSNPKSHAMDDLQSVAGAEKNCYDISELLLHATLRFIAVEERALHNLLDQAK